MALTIRVRPELAADDSLTALVVEVESDTLPPAIIRITPADVDISRDGTGALNSPVLVKAKIQQLYRAWATRAQALKDSENTRQAKILAARSKLGLSLNDGDL